MLAKPPLESVNCPTLPPPPPTHTHTPPYPLLVGCPPQLQIVFFVKKVRFSLNLKNIKVIHSSTLSPLQVSFKSIINSQSKFPSLNSQLLMAELSILVYLFIIFFVSSQLAIYFRFQFNFNPPLKLERSCQARHLLENLVALPAPARPAEHPHFCRWGGGLHTIYYSIMMGDDI